MDKKYLILTFGCQMNVHESEKLAGILEQNGYQQEFLCGSDSNFAGRAKYFKQHGNYEVFDIYTKG